MKYHIIYYRNNTINFVEERPQNNAGKYEVQDIDKALTDLKRWNNLNIENYKLAIRTEDDNLIIFEKPPTFDFLEIIPTNGHSLITWLTS